MDNETWSNYTLVARDTFLIQKYKWVESKRIERYPHANVI